MINKIIQDYTYDRKKAYICDNKTWGLTQAKIHHHGKQEKRRQEPQKKGPVTVPHGVVPEKCRRDIRLETFVQGLATENTSPEDALCGLPRRLASG
jgi:hypothetical protein